MAHDSFTDIGIKGKVAYALHLQSSLFRHWGRYETAVEYEEQSLAIRQETGMKADIAESLNNLGVLMMNTGDPHSSRRLLNEAMAIYLELDLKSGHLAVHNNLGLLDFEEGQYNNAAIQYQKALDLAVETGDMNSTGTIAGNVAGALAVLGNYDEAFVLYETALDSLVETGAQVGIARAHSNIAATLWYLERYDESERHFLRSIDIKEELRRTAEGSLRRDYLAAQVHGYKGLAACRMRMGKFSDAFDAVEMASARYLAELIGDDSVISSGVSIDDYRTGLPEGTAILSFANTDYWNPILLIATPSLVHGVESDQQELIQTLINPYREDMQYVVPEIVEGLTGSRENSPHEALAGIVSYYRALITSPYLSSADEDAIRDIARKLYGFLFSPLEDELRGVDELRIIPQGALAFLPFETLIMPDGRYLVEAYDISYLPSLTVDSLLSGRIYGGDQQSMLAFGGAVYNQRRYERDMEEVQRNLEYIEKEAVSALSRGLTTRPVYKKLGLMNWSNLPGSLEEVETIRQIVPDAVVYSGADVSEPFVKELSGTGELARYEVIHFATHGIVVPEIPDLSAVILSLSEDEMGEEDGFLNAGEIAGLNIRSEFVNLSACETGLGKIVAGEGVVGLTQAFLVAGANGISVSLWEVSDESTSKFMTGLYTEARDDGNYARSMNVMKRRFIADPELNAPFYWAPFVYYGQ